MADMAVVTRAVGIEGPPIPIVAVLEVVTGKGKICRVLRLSVEAAADAVSMAEERRAAPPSPEGGRLGLQRYRLYRTAVQRGYRLDRTAVAAQGKQPFGIIGGSLRI